jgi:PAT family beta-lactamase induction signal transducer AmpG
VDLRSKLPIIAGVYIIEGFPMGVHDLWAIYLRRHEAPLAEIGLLASLRFAWTLKVLWSPLIDRFGERRQWICGSMAAMSAALLCIAASDPQPVSAFLWGAFWCYCLASATQDVAIDAYSIGLTDRGEEGPVNSTKAMGYRTGMLLATAGLLLPRWIGWSATFGVGAAVSAVMAFGVFRAPRVTAPHPTAGELWPALQRWLGGGNGTAVIAFVMLYRVGDMAMGPMLSAFWIDSGFSDEEIGLVSKALGIGFYVAGAVIGGWVVARAGIARSLWWLGGLAMASNLAYSAVAAFPELGRIGVYAAASVESLCGGMVSTAFLSYLMRICQRENAAMHYALLTAAYALPGSVAGSFSGFITENVGYATYFALTAAMALPAFAVLPWAAKRI